MKKLLLLSVIAILCGNISMAAQIYSDDIPVEHLNRVKAINTDIKKQTDKEEIIESANKVIVYSQYKRYVQGESINKYNILGFPLAKTKIRKHTYKNGLWLYDKVDLIVAEDVYKNGILYIKKGTAATGTVTNAQFPLLDNVTMQPTEIKVSNFTTKDINNNTIKLQGNIVNNGASFGPFASIIAAPARLPKNKLYTLYYK